MPIETYVFGTIPSHIDLESLPQDLHLMGCSGIFSVGNLSIAYYIEENENTELGKRKRDEYPENFQDLEKQIQSKQDPCDILITNYWPSNILSNVK